MKVLVATPCYGGNVTDLWARSTISLVLSAVSRGVQLDVMTHYGESLIPRARNDIAAAFLAGDWTDLLFIDSDIGFDAATAWRLLESEHDVAAAPYPLKRLDWESIALVEGSPETHRRAAYDTVINFAQGAEVEDGFVPVLDAGTGFMRISRFALELMREAYPEIAYEAEKGEGPRWAFFDTFIDDGRYLSEDYAFCRRWQRLDGRVMVALDESLLHRGLYTYGE